MANPWIEFVKEFRKKLPKDTPYKEVLKKAKVEYAKKKGDKPKAGTKGAKSKTHKGDLDFTTKKGDKDFHREGHDIKEKRDPFKDIGLVQETAKKLMADEAAKKGRKKAELEKKFIEAGGTKDELRREILKAQAKDLHSLVGGALLGSDPNTFTPMGGSLNTTKDERAKLVRKYAKAKSLVMDFLRKGQLNQKEFNNFRALTKILSKSKTDKYAKDFNKVKKEFNSKKYEKLMGKKMDEKSARDGKKLDTQLNQIMKLLEGVRAARPLFTETAFEKGKKVEPKEPLDITRKIPRDEKSLRKGAVIKNKTAHKRETLTLNAQGDLRERPEAELADFIKRFGVDTVDYDTVKSKFNRLDRGELLELQRQLTYLGRIPEDLLNKNKALASQIANQILQIQDDLVAFAGDKPQIGIRVSRDGSQIIPGKVLTEAQKQRTRDVKFKKGERIEVTKLGLKTKEVQDLIDAEDVDENDVPETYYENAYTLMGIDPMDASVEEHEHAHHLALQAYRLDKFDAQFEEPDEEVDVKGFFPSYPDAFRDRQLMIDSFRLLGNPERTAPDFYKVSPQLNQYFQSRILIPSNSVADVASWLNDHLQQDGFVGEGGKYHKFTLGDFEFMLREIEKPKYVDALNSLPGGTLPSSEEERLASEVASLENATFRIEQEEQAQQSVGAVATDVPLQGSTGVPLTEQAKYLYNLNGLLAVITAVYDDPVSVQSLQSRRKNRGIGLLQASIRNLLLGTRSYTPQDLTQISNLLTSMGVSPAIYQQYITGIANYPKDLPRPVLNDPFTISQLQKLGVEKVPILPDKYLPKETGEDPSAKPSAVTSALDEGAFTPLSQFTDRQQNEIHAYAAALQENNVAVLQQLRAKYASNPQVIGEFDILEKSQTSAPAPGLTLTVSDVPKPAPVSIPIEETDEESEEEAPPPLEEPPAVGSPATVTPATSVEDLSGTAPPDATIVDSEDKVVAAPQELRFNDIFNQMLTRPNLQLKQVEQYLRSIYALAPDNKDLGGFLQGALKHMNEQFTPKAYADYPWGIDDITAVTMVSDENFERFALLFAALSAGKVFINGEQKTIMDIGSGATNPSDIQLNKQYYRLIRPAVPKPEDAYGFGLYVTGINKKFAENTLKFTDLTLDNIVFDSLRKLTGKNKKWANTAIRMAMRRRNTLANQLLEIDPDNVEHVNAIKEELKSLKSNLETNFPHLFGAATSAEDSDNADPSGAGFGSFLKKMKQRVGNVFKKVKDRVANEVGDASKLGHQIASGVQAVKKVYGSDVTETTQVREGDRPFAEMANDVYNSNRKSIGNNHYVPNISSDSMAVYMNEANRVITIAFRGTANLSDAVTDVSLAVGNLVNTPRFKKDEETVRKLREEFPNYSFDYTGHSLGGTIAALMMKMVGGNRAVIFNAGYGINMGNLKGLNITSYATEGDAVSALGTGRYKENFIIKNPSLDKNQSTLVSHKMDNFTEDPRGGAIPAGATGKSSNLLGNNTATYTPMGGGLPVSQMETLLRQIDDNLEAFQDTNSQGAFIDLKSKIKQDIHHAMRLNKLGTPQQQNEYHHHIECLITDYNKIISGREKNLLGLSIQQKPLKGGSFEGYASGMNHQGLGAGLNHALSKVHPMVRSKILNGGDLSLEEHEHIKRTTGHYLNEGLLGGGMGSFWQSPAGANAVSINLTGRDLTGNKVGGGFGSMNDNLNAYSQMIGQQSGNPTDYLPILP